MRVLFYRFFFLPKHHITVSMSKFCYYGKQNEAVKIKKKRQVKLLTFII